MEAVLIGRAEGKQRARYGRVKQRIFRVLVVMQELMIKKLALCFTLFEVRGLTQ